MKKIIFRLSMAFFAFVVSLGAVNVDNFFSRMPTLEEVNDDTSIITACDFGLDRIDVEYKYTVRGKDFNKGVFLVTNLTDEPVSYLGYEKNHHADNWIRQNGRTTTSLICHMGMSAFTLNPNESATFEIPVPKNRRPFEAGFDFFNQAGDKMETSWTEIGKQRIFVEKSDFQFTR